jgi:GNAT superfamily N-acetyltransferase
VSDAGRLRPWCTLTRLSPAHARPPIAAPDACDGRYSRGRSHVVALERSRSCRAEAVEVLLEVFPDFPGSNRLGAAEERRIARLIHERTLESGLAVGRVDAWSDPPVGVAVWLRRPALDEREPPRPPRPRLRDLLRPDVMEALERFEATMQRLRALSRPDAHVYLDMIGVLPVYRRQGIATALIEAGHAWADDLGLPVALDTDTEENVVFYTRRGYEVMARKRLPDSNRELVAMRRRPAGSIE